MKHPRPATFKQAFIGLLCLSLCLLPLLGLHIHLAATHQGSELHSHHAETHGFHVHTTQHDNIDIEAEHLSDTQKIDLDTDTRQVKVFKVLALIALAIMFLAGFITSRSITQFNYIVPLLNPFEIFRALLRGPPTV